VSSRDTILNALRRNAPPLSPAPRMPEGITYPDPEKQFAAAFTSVGGEFVRVPDYATLNVELDKLPYYTNAHRIVSLVEGVGTPNVALDSIQDPHALEGVDLAIIPGEFGVAENGAVWIPGSALGSQRAVYVISEHLVLVVAADRLVSNMHQAYERVKIERPGFGLFISGPSKTADIEQALVIGAHGPRSCTLYMVGP